MYEVIVEAVAAKGLRKLPIDVVRRIANELRGLASEARPPRCRKMVGGVNAYRIRVGDYRIVYESMTPDVRLWCKPSVTGRTSTRDDGSGKRCRPPNPPFFR